MIGPFGFPHRGTSWARLLPWLDRRRGGATRSNRPSLPGIARKTQARVEKLKAFMYATSRFRLPFPVCSTCSSHDG
jgi:hypothetical protein